MRIRTCRLSYAFGAVSLLVLWSSAGAFAQLLAPSPSQASQPENPALSSVEQGHTQLVDSFDFRQFQLDARRRAFQDTKFEFNLRTMWLDRNNFDGSEDQAWALGGWAGFKTGYFLEHIAFGATGYAVVPLHAPDDRDGTLLLKPGQEGYAVLGEAFVEIKIVDNLLLTVGRKAFDTPFINRNDSRMTPNTFEAAVIQGKIDFDSGRPAPAEPGKDGVKEVEKDPAFLKYGFGYFNEIKERNSDEFVPMSQDAGASVKRGVFALGAIYQNGAFSIGGIDYYCDDTINIAYGETKMELPFSKTFRPKLAAQFVHQSSVGDDRLEGDGFNVGQFGLKFEFPVTKRALFTFAWTQASGDTNLRSPWSGYPGYTSVQVQDFNREGEGAFLFRVGYEFPFLDGLSAYALAVFGTDPDGATQYRQDEYDMNVQWAPPKGALKGLSIRFRYAIVDQHGGNVANLTDFRGIVNYAIKF